MKLDELRDKINKHAIVFFLVFIVLLSGILLKSVTVIGSVILIVLALIVGSINAWYARKVKLQYYKELYKTFKDTWKLLRRKEPPL